MVETPGEGVSGQVDGHADIVGGAGFLAAPVAKGADAARAAGAVAMALRVDGHLAGRIVLADAPSAYRAW